MRGAVIPTSVYKGIPTIFTLGGDEDLDSPVKPKKQMFLTAMYKDGEPIFKNAKYDEIGRIVSYYKYSGEFKYSYEGDRILRGKVVYTIKNGLISTSGSGSDEEYNRAFTYINNKLSEVREWDSQGGYKRYKWENGNMLSCSSFAEHGKPNGTNTFKYISQPNYMGIFQSYFFRYTSVFFDSWNIDPFLAFAGYFGDLPKNLVVSAGYSDEGKNKIDYTKFNEYGYPTEVTVTWPREDYYNPEETHIYTMNWEFPNQASSDN